MSHKRYKDQILLNILQVCAGGWGTKTQIVYKSGLNFHTIIPYLDLLTHSGLVVRTEGTIRDDREGRSSAHTPAGGREAGVGRNR
ncbi:MAG: hypothetical protein A4E44_02067 [Methanosaeta sp. PtaB.Bin018]|jgi:predicted transcriptional regulator|nr:hypothetical protein [Methanothrix sp.]OPX74344.1 MAG: hypothetical protein A4E44_02067 [Methanosaeta sp. PtaB.Bin018]